MKYIYLAIVTLIFALPGSVWAQSCSALASNAVGTTLTYKTFDGRDRLTSTSRQHVISNKVESGYQTLSMEQEVFDGKGSSISKGEYIIRCQDGVLFLDMTKMVPPESVKGMEGMEVRSDQNLLKLPSDLIVGQMLPEATLSMELGPEGASSLMTLDLTISDRKVAAKESLEVSAGTFDTVVLTQKTTARTKVVVLRKTYELNDRLWFDQNRGILIKSESFDKKGNPKGYTLLTDIEISM